MPELKMWSTQTNGGYSVPKKTTMQISARIVREHREAKECEARLDTEAENIA